MDSSYFKIDTTLNIENIIAALAILGAAIGFLINLIKGWKTDFKEKRYRGTNHIILDLLEINFQEGLSEENLWELYCSSETKVKRNSFSAYNPKKLKRIGFENQLKHLQSRFLIRLTGPAHYHIDFREPNEWKRHFRRNVISKIVESVKNELGEIELKNILNKTIESDSNNFYRIKDIYRYLLEIGDDEIIKKLTADLRSSDTVKQKNAAELFIDLSKEST